MRWQGTERDIYLIRIHGRLQAKRLEGFLDVCLMSERRAEEAIEGEPGVDLTDL